MSVFVYISVLDKYWHILACSICQYLSNDYIWWINTTYTNDNILSICLILSVFDKYWHILISICQYLSNTDEYWDEIRTYLMCICQYLSNTVSIRQILTYTDEYMSGICLILSVFDKYWHISEYMSVFV